MDYEIEPIVEHLYNIISEQEGADDGLGAVGRKKTAARMVGDKWKSQLASLISKYKTGKKEQWKDWLESNPYEARKLADQCLLNPNAPLCKQLLQPCPEGQTRDPKTGECVKGEGPGKPEDSGKPGGDGKGGGGPVNISVLVQQAQEMNAGRGTINNITNIVNDNDVINVDNSQLIQQIQNIANNNNINIDNKIDQKTLIQIRQELIDQKIIVGKPGIEGPAGAPGPPSFENPPLRLPVLTLVKLDNNGVKFYRNTKKGDKQVDAVLALMSRARKQGIVGNNTSPYTSNDLDTFFGKGGRKMTDKTPDEFGGYDAMMRAILPKGRKISDGQTYFTVDASIYSDIAKVTNRPEEEIYEPVTKIVQSFLKRLVQSKEGSRGAVSVDDAIKSIKYRFRNKIGNEELQSVLSIFQTYGLAKGASGKELKRRKQKRRGEKERRRMRENIDTIADVIADILIEKFRK
jgi:hypothetical protein